MRDEPDNKTPEPGKPHTQLRPQSLRSSGAKLDEMFPPLDGMLSDVQLNEDENA